MTGPNDPLSEIIGRVICQSLKNATHIDDLDPNDAAAKQGQAISDGITTTVKYLGWTPNPYQQGVFDKMPRGLRTPKIRKLLYESKDVPLSTRIEA